MGKKATKYSTFSLLSAKLSN